MNQEILKALPSLIEYLPDTGEIFLLKDGIRLRKLFLNENNSINISARDIKLKLKGSTIAWFMFYQRFPSKDEIIFHKDLDETNLKINNLTLISKKTNKDLQEALKNLSGELKLVPHTSDSYCYVLEYRSQGRIRKETIADLQVARKKLAKMQLRFIKLLGAYVVST